ncbi:MAG TPA: hypothetical protein VL996_00075 [Methylocella sp.]|nr:hypothetical protein [Methylocella sp.]
MRSSFNAVALSGDLIPQSLPLVQATWPAVGLTAWQTFVQFFTGPSAAQTSGVIGLRDSAYCLCGVLAYRLDRDLLAGPMLAVDLFTAVDVANSPRTIQALLDAAEAQARELGCLALRIRLCHGQADLASRLRTLGLSSEIGLLWKKVTPSPNPN